MKIYKKGNYIVFDSVNGVMKLEHANQVMVSKSTLDSNEFIFASDDLGIIKVLFSDIEDENGDAYSDLATFNTFIFGNTGFNPASGGSGAVVVGGKILAITELSNTTLVTHTVPTGSNFTAINLNSDGTNRFAKITFTAPTNGNVLISMLFEMTVVNSSAVQMIGIHSTSSSTTTPDGGWYRINADNDGASGQFYAEFVLTGLTPGNSYTYYFMGVCNFASNTIRASSKQIGAYSSGSDLPSPLRITTYDLGEVSITSNPSS